MKLQKPPLGASLLTLAGVGLLCVLGAWQVQRLHWKESLIANMNLEPVTVQGARDLAAVHDLRPALLRGVWRSEAQMLVQPVIGTGHVYTLFVLRDGTGVWVNRGVMAATSYVQEKIPPKPAQRTAPQGLLATAPAVSYFKPANDPEKRVFFSVNTSEMNTLFGVRNGSDKILYQQNGDTKSLEPFIPELRNNHRGYALFWFAMAATLLCVFGARFMVSPAHGADKNRSA